MNTPVKLEGHARIEHIRDDKVINIIEQHNDITNDGLDALLNIMFHNATQISTWYLGLVDNGAFTAFADTDTMGSHAGWAESADYDEATRGEWTEGAASTQSITNASVVTFTIDDTVTLKGIFVTSSNTKSGTAGTLWSTVSFASVLNVVDNDSVRITYTINASG